MYISSKSIVNFIENNANFWLGFHFQPRTQIQTMISHNIQTNATPKSIHPPINFHANGFAEVLTIETATKPREQSYIFQKKNVIIRRIRYICGIVWWHGPKVEQSIVFNSNKI